MMRALRRRNARAEKPTHVEAFIVPDETHGLSVYHGGHFFSLGEVGFVWARNRRDTDLCASGTSISSEPPTRPTISSRASSACRAARREKYGCMCRPRACSVRARLAYR